MRKVAVAGIGLIKVKEYWDRPIGSLFQEAAYKAMKDAGTNKIDSLYVANMSGALMQDQLNMGTVMADVIAKPGLPATRIEAGSASGGVAFHEAVKAVASGYSDCVMVGGVEKMSDVLPEVVTSSLVMSEEQEYTAYTGVTKAGLSAMLHRLYLDIYASPEEVGMMAVKSHDHAVGCRHAQYPFKMSIERAMASPMEADPIRMMECSGIGDGAAALILVPAEDSGVEVAGSAVATDYCSLAQRDDPLTFNAVKTAADRAYKMAGVKPSDINLAEVHDDYTINGVLSLEALGLVEQGKAAKLVAEQGTARDGKIPTNTMGGLKARGNPLGATGIYQVAEVALQLRGAAGDQQIEGAEVGLAQNMGGIASICAVNVLRRLA
ncbi:MAG: thiolase domain-containing protein [Candidatus Bathyarchaeota archaeon]|nr:thiolase domain-containing protein [Candidatus Bathyarchaeota archaeon]